MRIRVLLSLQVALLDMVTPNMRAITCKWDSNNIFIRFIYDGEISEKDKENCDEIATEVISHFSHHKIEFEVVRSDVPTPLKDQVLNAWVYKRCEVD